LRSRVEEDEDLRRVTTALRSTYNIYIYFILFC